MSSEIPSTDTKPLTAAFTTNHLGGNGSEQLIGVKQPLNLKHLVNLALSSSPKAGVVNFNLLKVFLLELLKALDLGNHEFKLESSSIEPSVTSLVENEITAFDVANAANQSSLTPPFIINTHGSSDSDRLRSLEDKMGRLESQFSSLTNSLPSNQTILEKAKQHSSSVTTGGSGSGTTSASKSSAYGSGSSPILEIWQYTQMSKRMDANEDGLSKLSSLLQDLIDDMVRLKEQQEKSSGDIKRIDNTLASLLDRFNSFEKLKDSLPSMDQFRDLEKELEDLKRRLAHLDVFDDKLKDLTDQIKGIENKIYNFVTHPDLELYVTWPGLENCLRGLREALDSVKQREDELAAAMQTPRPIEQKFTQTTPPPPKTPSPLPVQQRSQTPVHQQPETKYIKETVYVQRPPSHHGHPQPSKELQEILSKLGTLNDRHEKLRELVDLLRNELGNKMDKSDRVEPIVRVETITAPPPVVQTQPSSFKLPDDFGEKIDEIRKIMNMLQELKNNFGIETNRRLEMERILANLGNELDNIKETLKECLKNTQLNKNEIDDLKEAIRLLEETKADKDWVRGEFERKADKRDLDLKVNKKTFDESINDVSNSINGCIAKNTCLEDEWRKGSEKIFKELENKLDRLELNSLKDYIEKQLKKLKKLQKESLGPAIQALPAINPEDDAAGLRKPLLRFHCLSCDRPLEITHQHSTLPSLPAERGIRPIQTPRPYQTFELEQIRQFQKQQMLQDPLATAGYDLYATVRQCGGPHTLTLPQKKLYKIAQPIGSADEVPATVSYSSTLVNPTTHKSEVQLQGQDGHIYKGRIDARLSVEMKRKMKNANMSSGSNNPRNNTNNNITGSASNQNSRAGATSAHYSRGRGGVGGYGNEVPDQDEFDQQFQQQQQQQEEDEQQMTTS